MLTFIIIDIGVQQPKLCLSGCTITTKNVISAFKKCKQCIIFLTSEIGLFLPSFSSLMCDFTGKNKYNTHTSHVSHSHLPFLSPKKSVPYMHRISSPGWISLKTLTHARSRPVGTNLQFGKQSWLM